MTACITVLERCVDGVVYILIACGPDDTHIQIVSNAKREAVTNIFEQLAKQMDEQDEE